MRILTRYVLGELLLVFLVTLSAMTGLIFFALAGKEAVDNGLGFAPLLRMLPFLLPQAMQFAVPGTMLLATTSVYGRLASTNEMVATKAMGISPWTLTWPTLALATLVSLGAVLLNDIAVSWGRLGQQRVLLESLESVAYGRLKTQGTYSDGRLRISVRRVDDRRLVQPTVVWQPSAEKEPWNITAAWGELESQPAEGQLVIRFYDVSVEGPVSFYEPGLYEHKLPLDELMNVKEGSRSPSTYALSEISTATAEQHKTVEKLEQELTTQAAYAMLTGSFGELTESAWRARAVPLDGAEQKLHRFYTEPYRRWATGFSCLCFVMVGVPVAVIFRKGEMLASFFICFLPILMVYYPLLMLSVSQAKDGTVPPMSVWVGNAVLAIAGLYLMRRVVRY